MTKMSGSSFQENNAGLSDVEKEVLRSVGFNVEDPTDGRGLSRLLADTATLIEASLSVEQAAALLGVSEAGIRRRLAARELYGFVASERHWLPSFQFDGQAPLPGLDLVLGALHPGLHPLEVEAFFLTPDADLEVDTLERPLSPTEWLKAGLSVDTIVGLAAEL